MEFAMNGVGEFIEKFKSELQMVIKFWTDHSHDSKNGGFYSCLSETGEVYDTTKYTWMQARQVWMYAKLYNTVADYHTTAFLQAAIAGSLLQLVLASSPGSLTRIMGGLKRESLETETQFFLTLGGEFLTKYVQMQTPVATRCCFSTTEDGKPCKLQRKPYAECFYIMALSELGRAMGGASQQQYQIVAETMLSQLIQWVRVDNTGLGLTWLPGKPPGGQELGYPMMLLNVLSEFCGSDESLRRKYSDDFDWAVSAILKHSDGEVVREHIAADGTSLPGCQGRLLTPGHALEAGWFLLQEAKIRNDDNLQRVAIEQFIDRPHVYGRDPKHGGLFYFVDRGGHCPTQLEWSMKLWWVHCEGMLASLLAYQATRERRHWDMFAHMAQLCFTKFSDQSHGEWYGYLTQDWQVNLSFKGGPYKGCFHIPRTLLYCLQTLQQIQMESP